MSRPRHSISLRFSLFSSDFTTIRHLLQAVMGNAASVLLNRTRMAESNAIEVVDLTGDHPHNLQTAALPIPPLIGSHENPLELDSDGDEYGWMIGLHVLEISLTVSS
jgi:hypothetical protein